MKNFSIIIIIKLVVNWKLKKWMEKNIWNDVCVCVTCQTFEILYGKWMFILCYTLALSIYFHFHFQISYENDDEDDDDSN